MLMQWCAVPPNRDRNQVTLIDDAINTDNAWRNAEAGRLTLRWDAFNISASRVARVDIMLYGYWEDVDAHSLKPVIISFHTIPVVTYPSVMCIT